MTLSMRKNLSQSVANIESLTNLKIIIKKCDKKLLQTVTGITELGRIYYKVLHYYKV